MFEKEEVVGNVTQEFIYQLDLYKQLKQESFHSEPMSEFEIIKKCMYQAGFSDEYPITKERGIVRDSVDLTKGYLTNIYSGMIRCDSEYKRYYELNGLMKPAGRPDGVNLVNLSELGDAYPSETEEEFQSSTVDQLESEQKLDIKTTKTRSARPPKFRVDGVDTFMKKTSRG